MSTHLNSSGSGSASPVPVLKDLTIPQLESLERAKQLRRVQLKHELDKIDRLLAETRAKRQRLEEAKKIQNLDSADIARCFNYIGPWVKEINFICSGTADSEANQGFRKKLGKAIKEIHEEVEASVKYYNVMASGTGSEASAKRGARKVDEYVPMPLTGAAAKRGTGRVDLDEYVPMPVTGAAAAKRGSGRGTGKFDEYVPMPVTGAAGSNASDSDDWSSYSYYSFAGTTGAVRANVNVNGNSDAYQSPTSSGILVVADSSSGSDASNSIGNIPNSEEFGGQLQHDLHQDQDLELPPLEPESQESSEVFEMDSERFPDPIPDLDFSAEEIQIIEEFVGDGEDENEELLLDL